MSVRNWLKKRAYFNKTVGIIQAMTLMLGDEGKLLAKHSGVREGILLNFTERRPEAVAATYISAALVADSIDEIDDAIRRQTVTQLLNEWAAIENPRSIRKHLREGTLNQDALLTRLQWLFLMGQDMVEDGEIEPHDFLILKDEIYGALKGEMRAQRISNRLGVALGKIVEPSRAHTTGT